MSRPPRRQLPLPDGDAPKRPVPPPPADDNEAPPPIPGRRPPPPPPSEPEKSEEPDEVYDDGDVGEIYDDDVEIGEPEDTYDDGTPGEVYSELEEEKPQQPPKLPPGRPGPPQRELPKPPPATRLPPPPPVEEQVYEVEPEADMPTEPDDDNIYEMEPDVEPSINKAPPKLPSRPSVSQDDPQETYDEFELEDAEEPQQTYDDFDVQPQEVYEDVDDDSSKPPPPPPPVGRKGPIPPAPAPPPASKATPPIPKPKDSTPAKTPVKASAGPGIIDTSAIMSGLQGLRKVGIPPQKRQSSTESDKIYGDDGIQSAFEKFKAKDAEIAQKDFRGVLSKFKNKNQPSSVGNQESHHNQPKPPGFSQPKPGKWGQKTENSGNHITMKPLLPPTPAKKTDTTHNQPLPPPFKPKTEDDSSLSPAESPASSLRISPEPPPGRVSPGMKFPTKPEPSPRREPSPVPASRDLHWRTPSPPSTESLPPPPPVQRDRPVPVPYTQVKPHISNGNPKPSVDEEDEDDDIYDDAISNRDPLLGEPWYFKTLKDRKTGDKLLKSVGKDGTFLIRESTKKGNLQPYTMMVLFQNNVYNLKIRERADGKMALGEEKPDEMAFMDVQKLVKYHRETEVILVGNTGQYKTLLKHSPPQ